MQTVLQPFGDEALRILDLTRILVIGGAVLFGLVLVCTWLAVAGPPHWRDRLSRRGTLVAAGIVLPVVVLSALLVYSFMAAAGLERVGTSTPGAARVQVTGESWWWRVRYHGADGAVLFETANEIRVPAGQTVELELRSADVVHSFWVPSLTGKLDMIPGAVNRLRLRAGTPGVYRGQCAEFCGLQHARMALYVVALDPQDFRAWVSAQSQPALAPSAEQPLRGQALFGQSRCGVCHRVRGTAAAGEVGPDLTHVGSRLSIAGGTLPNDAGTIAAWIADTQQIKPGSRMPAYRGYSGDELRAIAAYLEGLR